MRRVAAFTGILNLDIRKPCLLIFFSVVEEEVASRVILLKMTVCLLGTHFPNPMNAARDCGCEVVRNAVGVQSHCPRAKIEATASDGAENASEHFVTSFLVFGA